MAYLPSTWQTGGTGAPDPAAKGKRCVLSTVNHSTKEYKDVEAAFSETVKDKKVQNVLISLILYKQTAD